MSKKYTNYITDHCANVEKAFLWLVDHKIIPAKESFARRVAQHDLSKWCEEEYDAYDKYFYGKEKTAAVKEAFNKAWLHHIHHNPHHWQHWVLINDDDGTVALEMPEEYVIEMLCDHLAFSFKENKLDEIFSWYKDHKNNMILHKNTKALYESLLNKYKESLKSNAD